MSVSTETCVKTVDLKMLPQFAEFILEHHYEEFLNTTLQQLYELKVPLLSLYTRSEVEKLSSTGNTEFLLYLAQNNYSSHIRKAIDRWKQSPIVSVKRHDKVVEDVTLVAHARKIALQKILPRYTCDPDTLVTINQEIDRYVLDYTTAMLNVFIELLDNRMNNHVQNLEQSQKLYQQSQALTHIGNFVWDVETNMLTWSDELYRIYELDPTNTRITSGIVSVYDHPEDAPAVRAYYAHAIETCQPFEFFYRIVLSNGRVKTVHTRGEVAVDGKGRKKIFGTVQDVTEQKDIERKLFENQVFIQRVADAVPAIIATHNVNTGKYKFINAGLVKLLGYEPQKVFDEGISFFLKIVHPDDIDDLLDQNTASVTDANNLVEGEPEPIVEYRYRMRHCSGEYRWFHSFCTVYQRNHQRRVTDVLNITLDITDQVKAHDILMQRTHELQQSNAGLEEFAYVASHDLKEPLRKISVLTSRLSMYRKGYDEEESSLFDKLISSSLHMQQMIDDLLSLSLVSTKDPREHCCLEGVFQKVVETFEDRIEITRAIVKTDGLPDVRVVPSQMYQLFQNLLSNSLKFVRPNITPVIMISHRFLSADEVRGRNVREANRYLELQITDNGIGFEPEFEEKIFAIFHRLHHKYEYEGTGIGLAICRKIVNSYGGAIYATSKPLQGSTFTITIPQ